VNTPPQLKSCGFWANPPIGEIGAQGAIPPPLEDDDRGVVVPDRGTRRNRTQPSGPSNTRIRVEDSNASRGGASQTPEDGLFFYGQETTILI
jgi:hypothetical protein